jgi:thiamine kinase-like enzyme
MMEQLPNRLSADYLTEALRRSGALRVGSVRGVRIQESRNTVLSAIVRLRIEYEGADHAAPQSLIFKTRLPESLQPAWNAGAHEVDFYAQVAVATPTGLLPRCFDGVSDRDGASWHLLLEDLTDTHYICTTWPLPPSFNDSIRIIQARACFHAAWWDHPSLGVSVGNWASPEDLDDLLQEFEKKFAQFVERTADLVTPDRRLLYERLMQAAPRLNARYGCREHMTIVHGDAHFWNCFLSRGGAGVRFFDWDGWRIDTGADDLAYMIAMHWYPERRRFLERRLLDHYHQTLVARGVTGYDRRSLDDDYRLSVLWLIMRPVRQASVELPPRIWWNNYERIMMAVDDLDCGELLL